MLSSHSPTNEPIIARVRGCFPIATNADIWRARDQDAVQLWDSRDPEE
jgi:hypothetical protein